MMRCTKAREFISLDLDGQLPPDRAAGLTRHLDDCADCRGFREDLQVASRMLAASEPELPENFEWRLQLRLNQTLAEAAARELHPWHDRGRDRAAWWRNFGTAASVGMAAVLAVAVLTGPRSADLPAPGTGLQAAPPVASLPLRTDRLDLDGGRGGMWAGAGQRNVSTGAAMSGLSGRPAFQDRGFGYRSVDDLRDWARIQQENRMLRTQLYQMQRQLRGMQSPLDTTALPPLDLREGGTPPGAGN